MSGTSVAVAFAGGSFGSAGGAYGRHAYHPGGPAGQRGCQQEVDERGHRATTAPSTLAPCAALSITADVAHPVGQEGG